MLTLQKIIHIALTRLWWIVATTIAVTLLALWLAQKIVPNYSANTSLMFDFPSTSPLLASNNPRQLGSDYLMTQVEIIRSRKVATRAFGLLEIEHKHQLRQEASIAEPAASPAAQNQAAIAQLQASLAIAPSKDSRVIFISAESAAAATAAAVADAVAQAYLAVALELRVAPAEQQAAWFEDQIADLRAKLEFEQQQAAELQQRTGIINMEEHVDGETKRLDQLNASLIEAQARTVDMRSRQLGHRHPEYQRAIARELAIVKSLEAQRAKVFSLKQERNQLALLQQDLESAQATYNTALARMYEARLESQLSQTNVTILSPALIPANSGISWPLTVLIALVLGLISGFAAALLMELLDRRIHSDVDAARALQLPVLGSI